MKPISIGDRIRCIEGIFLLKTGAIYTVEDIEMDSTDTVVFLYLEELYGNWSVSRFRSLCNETKFTLDRVLH